MLLRVDDEEKPKHIPFFQSPLKNKFEDESKDDIENILDGEPELHRARTTSVIDLFYDLLFVANLTMFTALHEIASAHGKQTIPTCHLYTPRLEFYIKYCDVSVPVSYLLSVFSIFSFKNTTNLPIKGNTLKFL